VTASSSFTPLGADFLAEALPMRACIDAMRAAFSDDTENPLRVRLGVSLFMPARVGKYTGIKVVSTQPGNPTGLVTAFGPDGTCLGILEGTPLTLLRTGAGAGLATELLARPESRTMGMLGAGATAPAQIEAVLCVRPIRQVRIWSRNTTHARTLAEASRGLHPGVEFVAVERPEQAVEGADVVTCATPSRVPLFDAAAVTPGTHINAVGAFTPEMAEVPPACVRTGRVFVDDITAAAAEAGDLLQAGVQARGTVADLLAARLPGRRDAREVTLFKSVGVASQDVAAAVAALRGVGALAGTGA
jgi:ornithine cyclodeaminase